MSSVWGIFQCGSTLKVSIELPATSRHRRGMTERLLKVTLSWNITKKQAKDGISSTVTLHVTLLIGYVSSRKHVVEN